MLARLITLISTAAVLIAISTGCGGDGSDNTSNGSSANNPNSSSSNGANSNDANGSGSANGANGAGSGSDNPNDSAPTLSPGSAAYIKAVNTVCNRARQRLLTMLGSFQGKADSERELYEEAMSTVLLPGLEDQVDEIRNLETSTSERGQIQGFLSAQEQAIESAKKNGIPSEEELAKEFEDAGNRARASGISACAYG